MPRGASRSGATSCENESAVRLRTGKELRQTPGDVLCAALAACADTTFRLVATQLGLDVEALAVHVQAEVDVRGTLFCETGEGKISEMRMYWERRVKE